MAAHTLVESLQSRLEILEQEILRLTKQASQSSETIEQDNCYLLAQDLQREAREVRSQISRLLAPAGQH
jgi:hypothetical protein